MGCSLFSNFHFQMRVTVMGFAEHFGPCRTLLMISGAFYGGDLLNYKEQTVALVCGPKGADITFDAGNTWESISTSNLWVADFSDNGIAWLAGTNGKILKLELH